MHPNTVQIAAAPGAVNDLARFTDYVSVLGGSAVAPDAVANLLTRGLAWRKERDAAEAWVAYVKAEDGVAWREALLALDEVRPLFTFAVTKNPGLAAAYPWLVQLLGAGKAIAREATAKRARTAKVDAAAPKPAPVTVGPVTTGVVASPAPEPTKTITVNT